MPKSVNLTTSSLEEIQHIIKSSVPEDDQGQQLSDLGSETINAYQIATQNI